MDTRTLPPRSEMLEAFLAREPEWDGLFVAAVRTTGIFCRTTCPARRPRPENVEFFPAPADALRAGYRPCRRCRPLRDPGEPPAWVADLVRRVDADPTRRWTDADLEDAGLSPSRVRRWFQSHHGTTFHAWSRARRLGEAVGMLRGERPAGDGAPVTRAAFSSGFESLSGFNDAFRKVLGATPTDARRRPVVTVARLASPLGPLVAGATDDALCLLEFTDRRKLDRQLAGLRDRLGCLFVPGANPVLDATAEQVEAYWDGRLRDFDLPLETPGTAFRRTVWDALREIPFGRTVTYGALAARLGRPGAARAVAGAVGDNRIAVVVPCHRVVGTDGSLTGYGAGLWRKRRLLELEGAGTGEEG